MTQRKEMFHNASTGGKPGDNGENGRLNADGPVSLSRGLPLPCPGSCLAAPAPSFAPSFVSALSSALPRPSQLHSAPARRALQSSHTPLLQLLVSEYFPTSSPVRVLDCLLENTNTKALLASL